MRLGEGRSLTTRAKSAAAASGIAQRQVLAAQREGQLQVARRGAGAGSSSRAALREGVRRVRRPALGRGEPAHEHPALEQGLTARVSAFAGVASAQAGLGGGDRALAKASAGPFRGRGRGTRRTARRRAAAYPHAVDLTRCDRRPRSRSLGRAQGRRVKKTGRPKNSS